MSLGERNPGGDRLVNKSELCAHVAARTDVSRATADTVISTAFSMIGETLARDESVTIAGFGTFSTRARSARQGARLDRAVGGVRHPATGESISIAASKTPAFKAGKRLRETVNAGK